MSADTLAGMLKTRRNEGGRKAVETDERWQRYEATGPRPTFMKHAAWARGGDVQADTLFVEEAGRVRPVLVVVHPLSRRGYAEVCAAHTAAATATAMAAILARASPAITSVTTDEGIEFTGPFLALLANHVDGLGGPAPIKYSARKTRTDPDPASAEKGAKPKWQHTGTAVVESFNRTVRRAISQYEAADRARGGDGRWSRDLQRIVDVYNNSASRVVGKAPSAVTEDDERDLQYAARLDSVPYEEKLFSFKPGQRVRTRLPHGVFAKGEPRWSVQVRVVSHVNGVVVVCTDGSKWSPRDLLVVKGVEPGGSDAPEAAARHEKRVTRLVAAERKQIDAPAVDAPRAPRAGRGVTSRYADFYT